eukprot:TRINITY_DN4992_c0_g1_i3.p1 TRINITY_DN4992_c0_g1~~TRINITY_DN4992_c0_g1_i3.p1  ORF type:complete len:1325 (-),score=259.47 TRINITY_DN4992_c0_g1_i3:68-4042(-)
MSTQGGWQETKARGDGAYKAKAYKDALVHYTAALSLAPSDVTVNVLLNRAVSFYQVGNHDQAFLDARECMHLAPDDPRGYIRYSTFCMNLHKYEPAMYVLLKARLHIQRNDDIEGALASCARKWASHPRTPASQYLHTVGKFLKDLGTHIPSFEMAGPREFLQEGGPRHDLAPSVVSVSTGPSHMLILTDTHEVYGVGSNVRQQIQAPPSAEMSASSMNQPAPNRALWEATYSMPVRLNLISEHRIVQVSAGKMFSMALDQEGRVFTWGLGQAGVLGNGSCKMSSTPSRVSALGVKFVEIAAGYFHAAAISDDGGLYTWGSGCNGRLGLGSAHGDKEQVTPRRVTLLGNARIRRVACGAAHTAAVTEEGALYAFGRNHKEQLGVYGMVNHEGVTPGGPEPEMPVPVVPPSTFRDDVSKLLDNSDMFPDMIIVVGEERVHVHRFVLGARCPSMRPVISHLAAKGRPTAPLHGMPLMVSLADLVRARYVDRPAEAAATISNLLPMVTFPALMIWLRFIYADVLDSTALASRMTLFEQVAILADIFEVPEIRRRFDRGSDAPGLIQPYLAGFADAADHLAPEFYDATIRATGSLDEPVAALVPGGQPSVELLVPRGMLCIRNEYFKAMWLGPLARPDLTSTEIHEAPSVVCDIVKYLLTDGLFIKSARDASARLLSIVMASNAFDVPRLKAAAEKILSNSIDEANATSLLEFAIAYQATQLLVSVSFFINKNFDSISDEDISSLSEEAHTCILKSPIASNRCLQGGHYKPIKISSASFALGTTIREVSCSRNFTCVSDSSGRVYVTPYMIDKKFTLNFYHVGNARKVGMYQRARYIQLAVEHLPWRDVPSHLSRIMTPNNFVTQDMAREYPDPDSLSRHLASLVKPGSQPVTEGFVPLDVPTPLPIVSLSAGTAHIIMRDVQGGVHIVKSRVVALPAVQPSESATLVSAGSNLAVWSSGPAGVLKPSHEAPPAASSSSSSSQAAPKSVTSTPAQLVRHLRGLLASGEGSDCVACANPAHPHAVHSFVLAFRAPGLLHLGQQEGGSTKLIVSHVADATLLSALEYVYTGTTKVSSTLHQHVVSLLASWGTPAPLKDKIYSGVATLEGTPPVLDMDAHSDIVLRLGDGTTQPCHAGVVMRGLGRMLLPTVQVPEETAEGKVYEVRFLSATLVRSVLCLLYGRPLTALSDRASVEAMLDLAILLWDNCGGDVPIDPSNLANSPKDDSHYYEPSALLFVFVLRLLLRHVSISTCCVVLAACDQRYPYAPQRVKRDALLSSPRAVSCLVGRFCLQFILAQVGEVESATGLGGLSEPLRHLILRGSTQQIDWF